MSALREFVLESGACVIADLHLDVEDEPSLESFLAWLPACQGAPQLLILGDLFEFWVGPVQLEMPGARRVAEALARLHETGTELYIVPGNRDFLLGPGFEAASGASVHMDGLVGILEHGKRVLFVHGDELVTDDKGHLRLRSVLRSRLLRWIAPRVPRALAFRMARKLRGASKSSKSRKAPLEMEMKAEACDLLALRHRAEVVVCGHAHRYRDELLPSGARFVILDAYGDRRGVLRVLPGGELLAGGLEAE